MYANVCYHSVVTNLENLCCFHILGRGLSRESCTLENIYQLTLFSDH